MLTETLDAQSLVLDLGANVGDFSREISGLLGCRCVAVEPEPVNFRQIPASSLIAKLPVAAGATEGAGLLLISDQVQSHSLLPAGETPAGTSPSITVEVLTYRGLLTRGGLPRIDLLKMDIEGAEWSFLDSMTDEDLRQIPQITIEFHDFVPALRSQSRTPQACQRLRALGFICLQDTRRGFYNTLFVNVRGPKISVRRKILLRCVLLCGKIRQWINGGRRRLGLPPTA